MHRTLTGLLLFALAMNVHAQGKPIVPQADSAAANGGAIPPLPPLPDVNQEAFKRVRQDAGPLTEAQIQQVGRMLDDAERAAAEPPRFTPRAVSSGVVASLAPGATPPVARLFVNHVTTIVFLDQLGNPLSVRAVDLGAPNSFTMTWTKQADGSTNYVSLSPKSIYATGNIMVTLEGVGAPVSLTLISGQREVDYRVDVRVKGITAKGVVSVSGLPSTLDPAAMTMLGGLTPSDAKQLSTDSVSVPVWSKGQLFYVRTPAGAEMLSPAYIGMAKAPDGSTVYEIPPTPVIVVRSGGDRTYVNISGY
ncbi:DotH/IcmK family type IV secretion protein [Xanthomonas arboricola]|uniref:Intracellular multiplication protein IcmK n=1 Tax=Xanthomonas arboricola TaxID=56448 RepID=A0AB73H3N6_9XANT|nr:DotH/IcmK family type IV secretion protein [Xanthomonas arboricola]MBB5672598.1 intracellular multiplication protein IcmK [Xanthomonas arboricola]